ncbi:MAG TPA: lipoyl synthase [Candidatus Methanoperedens sp.]|nr:lipoyl synthase [Candidatus Methanoperedens sp.]
MRKPAWVLPSHRDPAGGHAVRRLMRELGLATVCESARCPNRGECLGEGTATFLILGGACTRRCGFCAVAKGAPSPPDPGEPARVAAAVRRLGLAYAVVTSVTRDDLPDGGAAQFAAAVGAIRGACPQTLVEVLVPDFGGAPAALEAVLAAGPAVLNHNLETVPRLYPRVRPGAVYERSLALLRRARASAPGVPTKSGLMVGLGEEIDEIVAVLRDLAAAGVSALTIGQYLQPGRDNLPVERYLAPEEFAALAQAGRAAGIARVAAGALVRSSYRARELHGR